MTTGERERWGAKGGRCDVGVERGQKLGKADKWEGGMRDKEVEGRAVLFISAAERR